MSSEPKVSFLVKQQFFVVSPKKLAIMAFFTFGWYWWFCFHRSWVLHKAATGERVLPFMRALFALFFIYPLYSRVDKKICQAGRSYTWSPAALVVMLFFASMMFFVLDHGLWVAHPGFAVLWFFLANGLHVLVITRAQCAINFCEGDDKGLSNSTLSVANWLWMSFGLLVWPSLIFLTLLVVLLGIDLGGA